MSHIFIHIILNSLGFRQEHLITTADYPSTIPERIWRTMSYHEDVADVARLQVHCLAQLCLAVQHREVGQLREEMHYQVS
jgi:hypothetical protein